MARTPWYIDALARHDPPTMRMLAYMALSGREGVMGDTDLAVSALGTPGASIRVAPGAFGILNTSVGGAFEAYVDKFTTEIVKAVNPTTSTPGGRTDLVICRVKNPYATGTGTWPSPPSPADGPYWDIDVIEGVTPNVNSVHVVNSGWSAITLARIVRPINTGVVQQSHIVDLRSTVDLSGQRLIDLVTASQPPIAQAYYTESIACTNGQELLGTATSFTNFPSQAVFDVPVPEWAVGMDVFCFVNPYVFQHSWGEFRWVTTGETPSGVPTTFDWNYTSDSIAMPEMMQLVVTTTEPLSAAVRGTVAQMRLQAKFMGGHGAGTKLISGRGTNAAVIINFKRYPVY